MNCSARLESAATHHGKQHTGINKAACVRITKESLLYTLLHRKTPMIPKGTLLKRHPQATMLSSCLESTTLDSCFPRVQGKPALQPTQWLHIADKSTRHSGEAGPAFRNKGQLVLQGQPALSAGGGHTGKGRCLEKLF